MKTSTPLTVENFELLLDRKLEEKLEQKLEEKLEQKLEQKLEEKLEQKFEEKLKPVKDEIAQIKKDIVQIKDVTENRIYKELKQTRQEMKDGFAHLDDVTNAIVLDYNDHDDRIKRLEKHTDSTNNN